MLSTGGVAGVGGGGGNQQKFYTEKHCPEVQPLNLLYPIFDRKGTSFRIPSIHKVKVFKYRIILSVVNARP